MEPGRPRVTAAGAGAVAVTARLPRLKVGRSSWGGAACACPHTAAPTQSVCASSSRWDGPGDEGEPAQTPRDVWKDKMMKKENQTEKKECLF